MSEITESYLAALVKQMRSAQANYFTTIAKAKQTKSPEDFTLAKKCLEDSKALEKLVDASVEHVRLAPIGEVDRLKAICHRVKVALLDKYGLFGGGHDMNKIFEILNEATPEDKPAA